MLFITFIYFRLSGVSIEFTKKHDIDESLNELKSKNVDPFNGKIKISISVILVFLTDLFLIL